MPEPARAHPAAVWKWHHCQGRGVRWYPRYCTVGVRVAQGYWNSNYHKGVIKVLQEFTSYKGTRGILQGSDDHVHGRDCHLLPLPSPPPPPFLLLLLLLLHLLLRLLLLIRVLLTIAIIASRAKTASYIMAITTTIAILRPT